MYSPVNLPVPSTNRVRSPSAPLTVCDRRGVTILPTALNTLPDTRPAQAAREFHLPRPVVEKSLDSPRLHAKLTLM